jgi:hypothetical protein
MKRTRALILIGASTFLFLSINNSAIADEVYRWTDSAGKINYGSKPPKGGKSATAVKGPKISRYSSDKALKSLKKSIAETNIAAAAQNGAAAETQSPSAASSTDKTARASLTADIPGQSGIQETNLAKGELLTKNLKTNYDSEGRLHSCTVELTNQASIPIANFAINFEFPDGTIVPGNGPELIDPGATVTYELSRAVLPLAFGAVGDNNPQPKVNISYF